MYHPPSKRKLIIQRTLVYGLMSIAVVGLVTMLVFVMLGYQFNRSDGKIEQGGLVQFDSQPTGATITIDGTAFGTRTTSKTTMTSGQQMTKSAPVTMAPKPAQVIKKEAVEEALAKAPSHAANHKEHKRRRFPRLLSVGTASLALLLLGGYFTYLNMPSLSVRVAAAQAGVNASYPQYRPDGYSLNGPVAYSQGQVTMKFAANAGPQNFTVNQSKSTWDSSAVLDNYVKQKAGDNYITYTDHGLTIYTFNGNAAWVNGGILYTINGDAPLSGDQIRHIATSM